MTCDHCRLNCGSAVVDSNNPDSAFRGLARVMLPRELECAEIKLRTLKINRNIIQLI